MKNLVLVLLVVFLFIACAEKTKTPTLYYGGCEGLAEMYRNGKGVQKDTEKAKYYLKLACDNKVGSACYRLGKTLKDEQQMVEANEYYGKACDLGDRDGCSNYKDMRKID